MPPQLALLLTIGFIAILYRRDFAQRPQVTSALWLPLVWMLVAGSRPVTYWLDLWGLPVGGNVNLEDGSPIDRLFYLGMIACGMWVLTRRQIDFGRLIQANWALFLFLGYCFLAVFWSDYPFVSLKRWIKVLGHPIMILVVLTEPNPRAAFIIMMKRAAYVLIPVSILFIKYYPELGRGFDAWSGEALNRGIARDKNGLGHDCVILGVFFVYYFLHLRDLPKGRFRREEMVMSFVFLGMIAWLLSIADSKTALACLLAGVGVMLFCGLSWVSPQNLGTWLLVISLSCIVLQSAFGIYEWTLEFLGRDPTLTDRTYLWNDLLKMDVNPLLGAGFESFWLGSRLDHLWELYRWRPNQAHNGYLETYLNLGLIGLFLLILLLVSTFFKSRQSLLQDFNFGRFRLAFLIITLLYNWTEAGFKTTHFMFFVFYLIAIDYLPFRPPATTENDEAEVRSRHGQHRSGESSWQSISHMICLKQRSLGRNNVLPLQRTSFAGTRVASTCIL